MLTTLYLVRHAATPANLMKPAKLQGRKSDPALAPVGVRQAEVTRDFLAIRPVDVVYTSPLRRAAQTAALIAAPHGLTPITVDGLTECDVGQWEGKSWEEIRAADPDDYARYHADPAKNGYRGGENFAQVYERAADAIDDILRRHEGQTVLVVSHHVVNRTFLAGALGLGPAKARAFSLDNCGISVVTRDKGKTCVTTLNSAFHLQGVGG